MAYWPYMEEMKWSSSGFHDLLCWLQTTLVLAWLWLNSAKLLARDQCQDGMVCPKPATHSIHSMIT
jgi:hypothetical protein